MLKLINSARLLTGELLIGQFSETLWIFRSVNVSLINLLIIDKHF